MKAISSFATNLTDKVLHMKTSTKIAVGVTATATAAAAGAFAIKARQAKKQERSVKSLVVEDAIRLLPRKSSAQESYEEALEQSSRPYVLPDFARKTIGFTEYDDFDDTFVLEPKELFTDYVIFYIHGHNFWADPAKVHFKFYKKLADVLGAELILPVYPKAPTHHVGDVQQMLLDRYLYLVNVKEVDPQNIIFAGDAAGGGLALSLLQRMKYQALPMPKQAILLSPWLDISNSNPDIQELQSDDPLLNAEKLAFQGKEYAGEVALDSPAVSPIYGDLRGLPPVAVFTGTHDVLSADAMKLEEIAIEQDLDINVYVFVNQVHFFMGLPIPEAKEALELIAEEVFLEECDCEECEEAEELDELLEEAEEAAEDGAEEIVEVIEAVPEEEA